MKRKRIQKDLPDNKGFTPLQLAFIKKNPEIVDLLLSAGVDANQHVSLAITEFLCNPENQEKEIKKLLEEEERREKAWQAERENHHWNENEYPPSSLMARNGISWKVWDSNSYVDGNVRTPVKGEEERLSAQIKEYWNKHSVGMQYCMRTYAESKATEGNGNGDENGKEKVVDEEGGDKEKEKEVGEETREIPDENRGEGVTTEERKEDTMQKEEKRTAHTSKEEGGEDNSIKSRLRKRKRTAEEDVVEGEGDGEELPAGPRRRSLRGAALQTKRRLHAFFEGEGAERTPIAPVPPPASNNEEAGGDEKKRKRKEEEENGEKGKRKRRKAVDEEEDLGNRTLLHWVAELYHPNEAEECAAMIEALLGTLKAFLLSALM